MKRYVMAIDQGTTSTRAMLFDEESNVLGIAQRELENYYPQPGWVEQNANDIWATCAGVIFEVLAKCGVSAQQIAAIGITNQRETTVIWDRKTGQPIYFAIVWQSRQSDDYIQEMKRAGKESFIRKKTGLLLDPYFSASKIRWILDHVDGAQQRAEAGELCFGTIDSWLIWKLTQGKVHVSDVSNASRTMLMNLKTLQYDPELLKLWNIPAAMLPDIRATSEVYGVCDPRLFGVEIPIGAAVGDQQAALFGQTCFEAGSVKNTYGTGCFLLMNTRDQIISSKHGLITCVGWKLGQEVDYVLEGSVFVAGAAIQWLRDGLKIIADSAETQKRAESLSSSDGVYVVPAFTGLGAPYWKPQAKGAIFGLTRGTTQDHIIRATLESLAYQTYDVIEAMKQDAGVELCALQVDGGASRNDYLLQFQSDLLNCRVQRSLVSETTALGAAYLAGLAVGYWPDKETIKANYHVGAAFESKLDFKTRTKLLKGWKDCIHALLEK
ncbi:MAG: glycerol kinase GlpK [Erysipelotrichaceae bacterium]|nr:glycerol kinase GlpK [Erysipelotrichaceae bacterium]